MTPASIDADDDFLWCSTDGKWYLKVEATTGNFIFGYVDADGTTLRTVTGPALVALEKSTYTITLRPDGVVFNVAGTDYTNSNIPYALSNGIEFFASDELTNNNFNGTFQVSFINATTIQDTDAVVMDGTITAKLSTKLVMAADFTLSWDGVFQTAVAAYTLLSNQAENTRVMVDGNDLKIYRSDELLATATGCFTNYADGQYYEAYLTRSGEDVLFIIDTISYPLVLAGVEDDWGVLVLYQLGASTNNAPASSVIHNLQASLQHESQTLEFPYGLNEGSGSAVNNQNAATRKWASLTNAQPSSYDLTSTGGGTSPPPIDPPPPPAGDAVLIFEHDFSDGSLGGLVSNPSCVMNVAPSRITFDSGLKYEGSRSVKFEVFKADFLSGGKCYGKTARAQLAWVDSGTPTLDTKTEYWFGYAEYIPNDWIEETVDDRITTIFFQIHGWGNFSTGNSPPFDVVWGKNIASDGGLALGVTYKGGDRNGGGNIAGTKANAANLSLIKGQWVRWVIRWYGAIDNTGYFEVWRNDVKVAEVSGVPTCYYDSQANVFDGKLYPAWDIYTPKLAKSGFNAEFTEQELNFDSIRVAKGSGGYSLVNPAEYAN